ncbi:MAG: ABC transporter ATP-binding protein [Kiritimatiellae bacterium]|nr:ABC transporter ATP-binding protein [Kiritimatiellia bacterium]
MRTHGHFGHRAHGPEEKRTFRELVGTLRHMPQTLKLVWSVSPMGTTVLCALTLTQGLIPAASAWVGKLIVDGVVNAVKAGAAAPHVTRVLGFVALEFGLHVLQQAMRSAAGLLEHLQGLKLTDHIAGIVHNKTVGLDLEYFENAQFYDRLHRAQQEVGFRPMQVLRELMSEGQNLVTILAFVGILIAFDPRVLAVLVATTIPSLLYELHYSRRMFHWFRARTETERRSRYLGFLLSFPEYAKELRLFELGRHFADGYQALRKILRGERMSLETRRALAAFATGILATGGIYACYARAAFCAVKGTITLGDMTMYYRALSGGQRTLQQLLSGLSHLYESNLFLSNLYELLALEPRVRDAPDARPVPRPMREGIVLEDVHFRYPGAADEVLKGIALTIRPGERIALVGENGAGKTTLVKLLCRLYDPSEGRILLDGVDLRQYELADLHDQVGVIFQDFARYEFRVRRNIGLGDIKHVDAMDRIVDAARRGGAEAVVQALPQQYETQLGHRFNPDGYDLSVGQWQKIALARAFMRTAQILILDEPTASLDARAEYEIYQRIRELTEGRAAVLISHRFSTVRMADHIYVLHGGRVIEHGPHDELMKQDGLYAHLFQMQAASYT